MNDNNERADSTGPSGEPNATRELDASPVKRKKAPRPPGKPSTILKKGIG